MGTLLWENDGVPHLGVVVKASFALRHDAPMVIAKSPEVVERDLHAEDDPTRSLVRASDVVPYRPMADVWLTGHAHAPGGRAISVSVARLALYRGRERLFEKAVQVIGDRANLTTSPGPFTSMPLVYERAYGGIGFDDNPVGVGADERPLVPNLVDPEQPERPAGFGPISRYWKVRRGAVDTALRRELEHEIPRVPRGFDWSYFQAAPPDQRVPFLRGDEWLVLDGLHPARLRIQSRVPKARGVARVLSLRGDDRGDAIAMVADALTIDADEQTCAITWRGSVVLDMSLGLEELVVAGGVEIDGRGVDFSRARALARPPTHTAALAHFRRQRSGESDELDRTSVDPRRPSGPFDPLASSDQSSGTYQRLEVDSGEWSSDGWPMYPLAGIDDEVTETKTRAELHRALSEERPTEVERRGLGLAIDTEPGTPPQVSEDELPWVTEPALEPVEPLDEADAPATDRPPASAPPMALEVLFEAGAAEATGDDDDGGDDTRPQRRSALPLDGGARSALPLGGRRRGKHESVMRPRVTSMPPAPLDVAAYEAALRRAGASDEDIERLLADVPGARPEPSD